ncbi:alpha/beta hydrolase [bacterium]|nr:alpha/beta hydrolase [bacterium]
MRTKRKSINFQFGIFHEGVRSAIFAGVTAPGTDNINDYYRNAEHSLLTVLERCENDEDCNKRYPNLKERLINSLVKLQSNPLKFEYEDKPFTLNVQDALTVLSVSLYDRHSIGNIPLLIEALENGESKPLANALKAIESIYTLVNWPVHYSITSDDKLSFYDEKSMAEYLQQSEIFGRLAISSNLEAELLKYWHTYGDSEFKKQTIISEIPALLVSGGLDHVTPISNATETLKHLKNGYELIFPDEGHNNLLTPCFFKIAEDFLNNPFQKPDLECSSIRNPIEWNLHKPVQKKN